MSASPVVVRSPGAGVVELRLNRPEQRNAVNIELLRQLRDELLAVGDDRTTKVVVLSGEGASFCAGADLREFAGGDVDPADTLARLRLVIACIRGLLELEVVTIAAVQGAAVGAGWGLALGCDVCWAADDARFRLPEVAKGMRVPRPLAQRLAQVVGPVRAAQILLSGSNVDVDAAIEMGAVTQRHPDVASLQKAALDFAVQLAEQPRAVLAGVTDPLRRLAVTGASPDFEYQWPESGT